MYLQLLPHWSFFCKAKKPQCPQLPLCHVQYHDSDYYISLFPKVVLSPTMDLSALISKPVPMDSYPFPGFGLLLSQHFIMDSLIFPASSFHLFKAHLPQENFLNLERQMQSLSHQSSLHSSPSATVRDKIRLITTLRTFSVQDIV